MLLARRLLCALCLVASASAGKTAHSNVILITLDTVRADRVGFLGAQGGLTPNLDALARESVVFTHAYSQVPLTAASHATILTGTYPQFHQINDFGVPLREDLPYAPDILRHHGYQTAAFTGSLILDPVARTAPGFDRGFDTYDAGFHRRRPGEDRYQAIERRGDEVVSHALAWLDRQEKGRFFVWVHLYDAHDPYDPPGHYKTRYAARPYDGEIAYVDFVVGKLVKQLRMRGLYDDAVMAVMADHGEALGEHGESTHGIFLYDETIRVPLLFKLPRQRSAGTRIDGRVELVDVLPTILQAVGVEVPQAVQGKSLLTMFPPMLKPTLKQSSMSSDRPAYSESEYGFRSFGWSPLRALRTGKYLFVAAPREELYDQASDPRAEHNLSTTSAAVTSTLASQLQAFRQKTARAGKAPQASTDRNLQEKLSALGYVASGAGASAMPASKEAGSDPKDKIEIANSLHRAEILKEEMSFEEEVPLLEQVIAKEPGLSIAYLELGNALIWMQKYGEALPVLRKAVDMRPDLTMPRYQLGSALFETGDFAGAAIQFESVVAHSPDWEEARFSLATAYARLDRLPEAIRQYREVIKLAPDHYGAHLLLGRALALSGDPAAAVPNLLKAAKLRPTSQEPHSFLADAYLQLGQEANAARERAAAQQLKESVEH